MQSNHTPKSGTVYGVEKNAAINRTDPMQKTAQTRGYVSAAEANANEAELMKLSPFKITFEFDRTSLTVNDAGSSMPYTENVPSVAALKDMILAAVSRAMSR